MKPLIFGTAATGLIGATALIALAATQADPTTLVCADYLAMDDTSKSDTFTALTAAHLETGGSDVDMTNVDATCAANPTALVLDAMAASG